MINLLPGESKRQIRAARTNVILLRYIFIVGLAIGFLGVVIGGTYVILTNTKTSAQATIDANSAKTSEFGSIQAQAQALKTSLQNAKTLLNEEIQYTKLITSIASITPDGVVLDGLSLSPTTIGAATSIQAYATTTEAALALKDAFQASSLFSGVTIQNISTSNGITGYPVNIVLGATINKGVSA